MWFRSCEVRNDTKANGAIDSSMPLWADGFASAASKARRSPAPRPSLVPRPNPPAVLRRSRRVRPLAGRSSGDREGGRSAGRGSCVASFCDAVEASRRAPDIRSARRSPNPRPTRRRVGDFLPRVAAVGSLVHVAPSVCGEANRRGDASRVTRGGRALTVPPRLRSSPGACGRFPASSGSSR